jgi:catechol 2,3-dioxygenase-like lactoylglutathione lyase family enzyme
MQPEILFPHTAIYTPSLEASLKFYRAFFGVEPKKVKMDYAKFELQNPKWNFTLNQISVQKQDVAPPAPQTLSHLGFQVASTEEVKAIQMRLIEQGITPTLEETSTTCCYAVQDKFWVKSPEGIDWEVFTVLADADVCRDNAPSGKAMCCAPQMESSPIQLSIPVIKND